MKTLEFKDAYELRMGSPYNRANAVIDGKVVSGNAQDIGYLSPGGDFCLLIEWNIVGALPGFNVVRIDSHTLRQTSSRTRSLRLSGCVEKIDVDETSDLIRLAVWEYEAGRPREEMIRTELLSLSSLARLDSQGTIVRGVTNRTRS